MLHTDTLKFLTQLDKNNNKVWFDEHRPEYEKAKADFEQFVDDILRATESFLPEAAGKTGKQCTFRIFKDVRFSKDKTPYKNNFGAGFGKGDKKMNTAGYYIHVQPGGKCFAGGGLWMPDAPDLKAIRQEIDYNFDEFMSIISKPKFKNIFGKPDEELKLQRPPKGYEPDNPAIEFLKLKSFTATTPFSDADLTSREAVKKIKAALQELQPFVDFLNRAIAH